MKACNSAVPPGLPPGSIRYPALKVPGYFRVVPLGRKGNARHQGQEKFLTRLTANRKMSRTTTTSAFTLLELILVLVVLGIGSAIAGARLSGIRGTVGVDLAVQQLLDQTRRCQHLAATNGQVVRLRLDLQAQTLTVMMLDDVHERLPNDHQAEHISLATSADALTIAFERSDAVASRTRTTNGPNPHHTSGKSNQDLVDLLFSPDARCDPAGTVTVSSKTNSAAIRIFAGARIPERVADVNEDTNKAQLR